MRSAILSESLSYMERSFGVRKGAWTGEEDTLLRKCMEKYGEGNWHKVPFRAGLNRCRKSCRLRWLNYLHPSIKRGEFTTEEVDLIFRMHKLLGNRWSLIAGRLPGRTANDIKNYWNTHANKRHPPRTNDRNKLEEMKVLGTTVPHTKVIRPQPRTFSNKLRNLTRTATHTPMETLKSCETSASSTVKMLPQVEDITWWERILFEKEDDKDPLRSFHMDGVEANPNAGNTLIVEEKKGDWDNLCLDMVDLWEY